MQKNVIITFDDTVGQTATITLSDVGTKTAEEVKTLVGAIAARLNVGVKKYSIVDVYDRESSNDATTFPEPSDAAEFNTCDQKCIYTYRKAVGEGDSARVKSSTIELPGPQASDFILVSKNGKRYTDEAGDDIATALKTFFGDSSNATFVEGWFKSYK